MHTRGLLADEGGLEENLGAAESLVTNHDHVTIGELVGLLEGGGLGGSLHLLVEIKGHIGELLLDISNDFSLRGGGEGIPTLSEDLHEVVSQVTAGKVQADDGVGKSVSLVDGDGVGHTITRVQHTSGGSAGGVQGEHGLDVHVHGGHVEGLEHDLSHALPVSLRIKRGLSEKDGMLLGSHAKLVVEGVVPDLLHVIPVGHDTMLDGVLKSENTSLGLGLVTDIGVLLVHTHHDARVLGATHDRGKDSTRGIITSKASLAHS